MTTRFHSTRPSLLALTCLAGKLTRMRKIFVVFSHGFGVSRVNYAALAQELASRGYVVLTIDHPYGGFTVSPEGRILQPGGDSLRRRLGSRSNPATVDSALAWDARRWAVEAAAARMGRERDSTWRAIAQKNAPMPAVIVRLRGTAHFSFSDAPFLMPSLLQGTGSTLSATTANALILSHLTRFFDHFLRVSIPNPSIRRIRRSTESM